MGGDWELVTRVALWGVGFGVSAAPALPRHHVVERGPEPEMGGDLEVWKGGLGVWGGILLARSAGLRGRAPRGLSPKFLDAAAPGLLLAQGIGRIGTGWNQELYGKPTDLPWGLKIDSDHRALALPQPRHRFTRPFSTS